MDGPIRLPNLRITAGWVGVVAVIRSGEAIDVVAARCADAAEAAFERAVTIPFLIGRISDLNAASFSFMPGVMPPIPLVRAAHRIDGTEIVFRFRVTERQTNGLPVAFKARLDQLASERVLSLACFLDTQAGLCLPSSALGSAPAYRPASVLAGIADDGPTALWSIIQGGFASPSFPFGRVVCLSSPQPARAASRRLAYPDPDHRLLTGSANSLLPKDSFSEPR